MSLKATIQSELQVLSAAGQAGSQTLAVATPVGQLSAILPAVDRFACALERLTLESPRLANASIDDLKQLSNALTQRLSYLLEPISLIESDASSATVQLRSNPPAKDDDQTSYYEIVARKGGSIELCRYVKQSGQPREVTAAHLTHEVVARLSQDFVDAVA